MPKQTFVATRIATQSNLTDRFENEIVDRLLEKWCDVEASWNMLFLCICRMSCLYAPQYLFKVLKVLHLTTLDYT